METPNPSAMEVNLETDQQVQSKDKPQRTELKRGLSARHMQMIAIGGAIGTGLFVASGATISQRLAPAVLWLLTPSLASWCFCLCNLLVR